MTLSNDKLGRNSLIDQSAFSKGAMIKNKLGEKVKKLKEGASTSEFKIWKDTFLLFKMFDFGEYVNALKGA